MIKNHDELHEECGVVAIWGDDNAAQLTYYGLHSLQHRGQEAAGIVVRNKSRKLNIHKGEGLVSEVFNKEKIEKLSGNAAIGHVRYSTAGGGGIMNVQPFLFRTLDGMMGIAHNGNIVNANLLKKELEENGSIFNSTSDTEVLGHLIKRETGRFVDRICKSLEKIDGAFAFVILVEDALYVARDRYGLRPLSMGRLPSGGYMFSSETCALDIAGAEYVRDVEPGEVVTLTPSGIVSNRELCFKDSSKQARCIFEYIYFARPDAVIDGVGVYASRIKAGRFLAMDSPVEADMVVGVPESGNPAAQGYAMESGIPYGTAFIKNSYVGRTFIKPKQSMRESSVQVKLNVLKDAVKGKRIVMIDDSIVRGTTCHRIVRMLKDAGAKEVHVRISSPPFLHPCYFGTDIPSEDQLIAYGKTLDEIRDSIEADTLAYLGMERLKELNNGLPYCDACFSGNYPIEPPTQDIRGEQG